jgi:hypothetical protein
MDKNNQEQDLGQILFDGLNEHGFIFQEKCAEELRKNRSATGWRVIATEYPVETVMKNTRIDIVLINTRTSSNYRMFAVVECKRVNPDRGYWLFGNPSSHSNSQALIMGIQAGHSTEEKYSIKYSQENRDLDIHSDLVDNWWLQIAKGSKQKSDCTPQPIEDAFLQACAGVSGIATEEYDNLKKDRKDCSVLFIPVIITTAPLYYAEYDLKDVDLASGYIDRDKVFFGPRNEKPAELKWLQVNYPVSSNGDFKTSLFSGLRENYQRSIFVVNSKPNHIVEFFSRLHLF